MNNNHTMRKQLLRKYGTIVLLGCLSLAYLYFEDWLFGYGLGNISYILNYLLSTLEEKLATLFMLLFLLIPDLYAWIAGNQSSRDAER
ncbi:hypothetical protein KIH86_19245 [Paenibacillus sp. HN-1]|uniref:hypothetical protein n=1 Tax=Paenibacillus TaxID=44249 RepID=UPI001CA7E7C7|nr:MULTISPECIES: hypothetical protein [Paenibacillus]MBY9082292.1 hypothetical protein [Paenibacillus sp. CGMCC 1.18879]MBY9086344.1 hypothetical protein [Paenibacillus sinensis]